MSHPLAVKICGIRTPREALAALEAGADAIGVVHHRASPRHLEATEARAIVAALPPRFPVVGVFANEPITQVLEFALVAGISHVQLHGTPEMGSYGKLAQAGLIMIQTFALSGAALRAAALALPPQARLLVECGRGPLPGGNGIAWDWGSAAILRGVRPFAVAGGLTATNVSVALAAAQADAVDVSSAVESSPGVKDLGLMRAFVEAARAYSATVERSDYFKMREESNES